MPNPLFDALFRGSQPSACPAPQMPVNGSQGQMQEAMAQLRSDPSGMIRRAGYNVPDEIAGNPQATVMHLIQTGQVGGPAMQRIQPMLNMLMGRR